MKILIEWCVNNYLWFTKQLSPNSAMGFNKLIIHGRKKTNKSKAHTSSFRFSNLLKKFPIFKTYNISDSGTGLLWTFKLSQILQCCTALQSCHSAFWDPHNFLTIFSFSDHPLSSLGLVVPKNASATAGFEILLPACLAQTTSSFWTLCLNYSPLC